MGKLYFYYSAMNAGKSVHLLQHNYNNKEKEIKTLVFLPDVSNSNFITSRIGISYKAILISKDLNLFIYIRQLKIKPTVILIDEVQFLTKKQVFELIAIVDNLNITIFTYGLRTDFKSKLFEASKFLLALADKIIEIKSTCKCGNKAIMNARVLKNKKVVSGSQVDLDKKKYVSFCRKHYFKFNF